MNVWIAVLGVGVGSYLLRAVPLMVLARVALGARVEERIGRAGVAAIAAMIAISTRSAARGDATFATLAAVVLGAGLALRGASMLRIMVLGGSVYAAIRFGGTWW